MKDNVQNMLLFNHFSSKICLPTDNQQMKTFLMSFHRCYSRCHEHLLNKKKYFMNKYDEKYHLLSNFVSIHCFYFVHWKFTALNRKFSGEEFRKIHIFNEKESSSMWYSWVTRESWSHKIVFSPRSDPITTDRSPILQPTSKLRLHFDIVKYIYCSKGTIMAKGQEECGERPIDTNFPIIS